MGNLLDLVDGAIKNIISDSWSSSGCETCDYGSSYVNDYEIIMSSGKIKIKVDTMYEYSLSEGDIMDIILPNVEEIKTMTEVGFFEWIKLKLGEKTKEKWESSVNAEFVKVIAE